MTMHALKRMKQRKIYYYQVRAALEKGKRIPSYDQREMVMLCGLIVVVDAMGMVVTAYWGTPYKLARFKEAA